MESNLEVFESNLPSEVWCEIFSYLDKKFLKKVSSTCKLWFGIMRGNERFSGHIKMKFTNLEDMSTKITDSEWLRERWPAIKVLKVSLGSQFMVAQHKKLFPNMTKIMKLNPLDLGCKRRKELIFHSNNVTIKIEDVIKKFKFEKFHILMRTQCHSSWRADCPRNRKRRRQSNNVGAAAYKSGFSKEPAALWCYSMIICIKGTFVIKTEKTVVSPKETTVGWRYPSSLVSPRYCFAPPNSPGI